MRADAGWPDRGERRGREGGGGGGDDDDDDDCIFASTPAPAAPSREPCACPMCGLCLTTWTLPDREAHADACVVAACEGRPREAPSSAAPAPSSSSRATGDARDFERWLRAVGLARHLDAFAREELTLADAPSLTMDDLVTCVGIDDESEARAFLEAAAALGAGGGGGGGGASGRRVRAAPVGVAEEDAADFVAREERRRREDARAHDDEWLRLGLAMSLSEAEAPPPPPRSARPPPPPPREPLAELHPELLDRRAAPTTTAAIEPKPKPKPAARAAKRSVDAAAAGFPPASRRRLRAPLWRAAAHGGTESPLPRGVVADILEGRRRRLGGAGQGGASIAGPS